MANFSRLRFNGKRENMEFQNAPYVIKEKAGTKVYCTCGQTQTQPYCNGSHKGTDSKPMIAEIEEDRQVAWCGCRRSSESPFCDGTHAAF